MSWCRDLRTRLQASPVGEFPAVGTSRGQTRRHQTAHGSPGSEVSHGSAMRAEVSESSLCPTCAPGPPGQRASFQTHTLGIAKSRGRWSPSPAPAPRVWPRGQHVHRKRAELQGCVLTGAQPPPTAPLSKKQPEASALTPSRAEPCSDTCPASRAAQRESKRPNGTGRFGGPRRLQHNPGNNHVHHAPQSALKNVGQ